MTKLRVLWATDGSEQAASAVPFLRELVGVADTHLTVLSVAPHPLVSGARPDLALVTRVSVAAKNQAVERGLEIARHELARPGLEAAEADVVSRWGNPIEQILLAGRRSNADLIVLGAKGHANLRQILLGSVAQGVVQNADRPVLVARPGAKGFRRILVGYDGSLPATKTLEFLHKICARKPKQLMLADVVEPFTLPSGTPAPYRRMALREAAEINQSRREKALQDVQAALDRFADLSADSRCEVLEGPASVQLERAAAIHDSDLVAVGSRKPSRLRHYLLGSTAEKLVRHSPTSVLVVR